MKGKGKRGERERERKRERDSELYYLNTIENCINTWKISQRIWLHNITIQDTHFHDY